MPLLLIPVYWRSSKASSGEKISAKSKYLVGIEMGASFATNIAIFAWQKGWTLPSWVLLGLSREVMWITKVLCARSKAATANSFFPTSSTRLVVRRAFLMV